MTTITPPMDPPARRKPARPVEDRIFELEDFEVFERDGLTTIAATIASSGAIYRYTDPETGEVSREKFGRHAFSRLALANARLNLLAAPLRPGYRPAALASTRSGTLRIARAGAGLAVEFDLAADEYASRTTAEAFRTRNLTSLGISFEVIRESTGTLGIVRTLAEVKVLSLFVPFGEVTVTPEP